MFVFNILSSLNLDFYEFVLNREFIKKKKKKKKNRKKKEREKEEQKNIRVKKEQN